MWASLENWLVQDGQIPELRPGDRLRVALRAESWSLRESTDAEGVIQRPASGGQARIDTPYDVTGTVRAARAPGSVLLRVEGFPVVAEPKSVREVGHGGLERYSPDFPIPEVGDRVTVACTLEVMAWYETEDIFVDVDEADLVHDWLVSRIRLAHWALVPMRGKPHVKTTGPLRREEEITGMRRWADESDPRHEHVTYVLDLEPLTTSESPP
jgi:hypothetical protein